MARKTVPSSRQIGGGCGRQKLYNAPGIVRGVILNPFVTESESYCLGEGIVRARNSDNQGRGNRDRDMPAPSDSSTKGW